MVNWKNLRDNPPKENCHICVKIGDDYETYKFIVRSESSWTLMKYPRSIEAHKIPKEAMYINLNKIV